jgi:hypothetical protein
VRVVVEFLMVCPLFGILKLELKRH